MANPLASQILLRLSASGYATMRTQTAEAALKLQHRYQPVLTIFDASLPDTDAVAFCQAVSQAARQGDASSGRSATQVRSRTGVLVLLPPEQHDQMEKLLDLGADDVLLAPVSLRLLTHRLKQLIEIQMTPQPFDYQQQFLHWIELPALICDRRGSVLTVNPALVRLCSAAPEALQTMTLQSLLKDGDPGNGRPTIQSRIAQTDDLRPFFKEHNRIERRVSLWRQDHSALSTTLTLRPIDQDHYLATFAPMAYTNPRTTSTQTQTVATVSVTDTSELTAMTSQSALHTVDDTATMTSQVDPVTSSSSTTEADKGKDHEGYETGDLFDDANDAILIVDIVTGSILNANRLACRWLDYTLDELSTMSIDSIEVPLNLDQQRQIQEMMSTTGQLVYEHSYKTKSGLLIPVEVSSRIIQYNGHNAFLCFARDITRRRQAEEAERMQRSLAEALRASVSVLNNSLDFNDVIEKMLELIDYVVPSDAANVMRIEGTQAQVIAHRGYELLNSTAFRTNPAAGQAGVAVPGNVIMAHEAQEQELALKTQTKLRDLPFTDWMHRNKLPIYISNTQELRQYRADDVPNQPEFRSLVGAPIIVENNVIGFIHLEARQPNRFTDEDAGRLMAFADQAGIALRNAQLFHRMQNHADELEQRVEERTAQLTRANHVLQDQMAERRKFENALAEERNLLRTIIDTLPDEVYVKDRNGRIVLQNAAASNHPDTDRLIYVANGSTTNGANGTNGTNGHSRPNSSNGTQKSPTHPSASDSQDKAETSELEDVTKPGFLPAAETTPPIDLETSRDTQLIRIVQDLTDQERTVIDQGVSFLDQERMWFDSEGHQHWMLTTKVPLYGDRNDITGLVTVRRDISALRGAEEELAQVVTGANCLLWSAYVQDVDGKLHWDFRVSSEEAAQHFLKVNRKAGQTYASAWLASLLPGDRKQREEISQIAIMSEHPEYMNEYRYRRADGEVRWLSEEVRIRPIQPGRWSLVGVCTDITERKRVAQALQESYEQLEARVQDRTQELTEANQTLKQQMAERQRAEQALRESETRFRALVENAPEAIVVFDVIHERYTNVNQNAVKLFGTRREDLLRKGPLDHCREYQPNGAKSSVLMRKYIQDALHGRTPVFEWEYIGEDDTPIPCEVRLLLLRDANSYLIRGSITDISERLRAQAALRESEQKYRSLTQQLPVGVYRALQDGKIQFANPAMAHILGYENPDELIGLSIYDFFLMEDGPLDVIEVKDHFPSDRSVIQIEHRVKQRDGSIIWVRDTGHIILDANEEIAYADYICEDITDRVNMQKAERKQRMLAEALKAAAEDLSRSLDLETIFAQMLRHVSRVIPTFREATVSIIESKHEALRSFHFAADQQNELKNQMLQMQVNPRDWPILANVLDSAQPIVIPDVHEYPGWIAVESHQWVRSYLVSPILVDGNTIGVINLTSDQAHAFDAETSEWLMAFANQLGIAVHNAHLYEAVQVEAQALQQRVEERTAELNIERTRLRAILDAMTEGVVFHDDSGHVLYSNRSLTYLLGYKINEIHFPQIWDQIYAGPDEEGLMFKDKYRHEISNSGVYSTRLKLRHRDNYEFDASMVSSRVLDNEGNSIGIVMVLRDVSQETRLEQQKKSFISSASHELRTPLTNLKTRLYLIRQDPQRLDEHLQVLETVTNRMRRLVEDLFDISRFENGVMTMQQELRELQPILYEVARLQRPEADKSGIVLEVELPETPAHVMVDEPRLIQVMTNLVTNALNHTDHGGRIRIDALVDHHNAGVIIGISDTGSGIPDDLISQIFKPFTRGKDNTKGAGLGLSISKEIIELHEGRISVTSEVGRGTRFEIWLPLYHENVNSN